MLPGAFYFTQGKEKPILLGKKLLSFLWSALDRKICQANGLGQPFKEVVGQGFSDPSFEGKFNGFVLT